MRVPIQPPENLTAAQREKWTEVVGIFADSCTLTQEDAPQLVAIVDAWLELETAGLMALSDGNTAAVERANARCVEALKAFRATKPELQGGLN